MAKLLLASSSPYRKELLHRLGLDFVATSPDIDESIRPGETADTLVKRLAEIKARALETQYPAHLIIGSDQVATLDNHILTKPGNHENAVKQLRLASAKQVHFHTGLCLYNANSGNIQLDVAHFTVTFRQLTERQIESYLHREQPYNCAGSFKSEGLGVALFEKMAGDDPSALIGLPLIRLTQMLQAEGVDVLEK